MINIQHFAQKSQYVRSLFLVYAFSNLAACGGSGSAGGFTSNTSAAPDISGSPMIASSTSKVTSSSSSRLVANSSAASVAASSQATSSSSLSANAFNGNIVLGVPTENSIKANIYSATQSGSVTISYGTAPGVYAKQTSASAITAASPLEVSLSGLSSNTLYYYRLNFRATGANSDVATDEYSFHTARPAGSTFSFTIQGDSHPERPSEFSAELYTRTLATAAADKPDFHITLGDDFSVDMLNPTTATAAQVAARYALQRPYLGIIGRSAPVFLVNGNHEQSAGYLLDGTANNVAVWAQNARNTYYSLPASDGFYTGNTQQIPFIGLARNYYAWTWGDALFVTIDPYLPSSVPLATIFGSTPMNTDIWAPTHGDAQYQWLKTTLEQSKAKYKFVFAHHVMGAGRGGIEIAQQAEWGGLNKNGVSEFAVKRSTWAAPIHQLMVANKVTAFFQGHDHVWVHQELDGVTYQTLSESANPNYNTSEWAGYYLSGDKFPNTGYTRVNVSPNGVKVDYVRTYLAADETANRVSGSTAFSYTLSSAVTTTLSLPDAPTNPVAQAGNGSATLSFTAPQSNGGATITAYTATCSAAGVSKTGSASASPISLPGLTNGTTYSCAVTATNSVGVGAASTPVNVTPTAPITSTTSTSGVACGLSYNAYNSSPKVMATSISNWNCSSTQRTLTGNGIPDHAVTSGNFATPISAQNLTINMPILPTLASTSGVTTNNVGYVLNSVKLDPATAGTCKSSATSTANGGGCVLAQGSDPWTIEAIGGAFIFGIDESNAHVQPNGQYHYHGVPEAYVAKLNKGTAMTLVGFAVDGFPIYVRYGYSLANDASSPTRLLTPSYRKKATPDAGRPSVTTFPMGTFTSDYEYVAGLGDLDECNGRTGVTPEFPNGIYHYFITDSFPFIQRCVKGAH